MNYARGGVWFTFPAGNPHRPQSVGGLWAVTAKVEERLSDSRDSFKSPPETPFRDFLLRRPSATPAGDAPS